jgi:hypothetical protein
MTGPEHYRAAELLQKHARDLADADDSPDAADTANRIQRRMAHLADAQVHATLALAAAVGLSAATGEAGGAGVAQRSRARFRHNGDDTVLTCGNMAWWPIVTAPLTAGPSRSSG